MNSQDTHPSNTFMSRLQSVSLVLLGLIAAPGMAHTEETDAPQIAIGERLFLETRFAQAYSVNPDAGDPTLATTRTTGADLPGPFAGRHINCRACHLVDEQADDPAGGMRSYTDFARLSPQPVRAEDPTPTRPRNAQSLVNIAVARPQGMLLHHDGQFASLEDLASDTLTSREFGWLPGEQTEATAHIARIIREDDGQGELAQAFGGAYRKVFKGEDPSLPPELRLPPAYRMDVLEASDEAILAAVARLIAVYMEDLGFSRDPAGRYDATPYDRFLERNVLPRLPDPGESARAYNRRLSGALEALSNPRFIQDGAEKFAFHQQPFVFGPTELQGLKLFLHEGGKDGSGGNCAACHPAPEFTDFGFHNTGATQLSYDAVHGPGAFAKLRIPGLEQRRSRHDDTLPATARHPEASGRFRSIVSKDKPGYTDLGLWNIYANPDFPRPQPAIRKLLCRGDENVCDPAKLLPGTIALFKTPTLRDLGHSDPYLHDGSRDELEDVIRFYVQSSALARSGELRNGAPELQKMHLQADDIAALSAFLRSLNEDYD